MLSKHLSEPWFNFVRMGLKTVEGRLDEGDWSRVSAGDVIEWYNDDFGWRRSLHTRVKHVSKHRSVEHLLTTRGLAPTLPGLETIEEGVKLYESYYKDKAMHTPVVGLTLEVI